MKLLPKLLRLLGYYYSADGLTSSRLIARRVTRLFRFPREFSTTSSRVSLRAEGLSISKGEGILPLVVGDPF